MIILIIQVNNILNMVIINDIYLVPDKETLKLVNQTATEVSEELV